MQGWPTPRDSTGQGRSREDCRRVAGDLQWWLNEALEAFVPLAPLALLDGKADVGGAAAAAEGDPAEQLLRGFLLLPPSLELYSHDLPLPS